MVYKNVIKEEFFGSYDISVELIDSRDKKTKETMELIVICRPENIIVDHTF